MSFESAGSLMPLTRSATVSTVEGGTEALPLTCLISGRDVTVGAPATEDGMLSIEPLNECSFKESSLSVDFVSFT